MFEDILISRQDVLDLEGFVRILGGESNLLGIRSNMASGTSGVI